MSNNLFTGMAQGVGILLVAAIVAGAHWLVMVALQRRDQEVVTAYEHQRRQVEQDEPEVSLSEPVGFHNSGEGE